MAKNPVFPLYYNDIDRSTRDWSDEEFGAYMRLLIHQWDKGVLPNNYQRLTRIATSLDTNWGMLKVKFEETPDGLKNPVLEAIREKLLKHKEKQKENIRKRYQTPTRSLPLENEDDIENEKRELMNKRILPEWDGIKKKWIQDFKWKESFCAGKGIKIPELETLMADFLLNNIELKEDYKTIPGLKSHFVNWFNKHKNGRSETHKSTSANGTKLGTSDARVNALKNW